MPQIQIPTPLRQYAGKQATVDVSAKNVGEALNGLITQHPELRRHLYTDDGSLRAFVNVYVSLGLCALLAAFYALSPLANSEPSD